MTKEKNVKELVNDNVTRHDVTRHCEEDKRSAVRRGNLLSGLLRHFVPRNDGNSGNLQSLLKVKNLTTYRLNVLKTSKKIAFTLAEVLITLGVIGIVAAMTIPTLISNYQEKVFVTGAKKFYSLISQAVQLATIDNGLPENWDLSDPENMIKPLMPYLKITDYCTSTNGKVCYNKKIYHRNGNLADNQYVFSGTASNRPAFRLSDGTNVGIYTTPASAINDSTVRGEYMVDVNGEKGPNTYGKDLFIFNLAQNGTIKPSGDMQGQDRYAFKTGCLNSDAVGLGCAAWVVLNGNMDYWHCDDLSWDGKHKCSD